MTAIEMHKKKNIVMEYNVNVCFAPGPKDKRLNTFVFIFPTEFSGIFLLSNEKLDIPYHYRNF